MGEKNICMFIDVSVCQCTYLYVNRHFQRPEPRVACWLWRRGQRGVLEAGGAVLCGQDGCRRRSWQGGEHSMAAAGDRSRRLQWELCKFRTRHSCLGREKWKSTFFPKVEAGGLHFLLTRPLEESNERRGKLQHRQERDDYKIRELFSGEMKGQGNRQQGSYWGDDGVGKMWK